MKSTRYFNCYARKTIFLALTTLYCAGCSDPSGEENKPLGKLALNVGISVQTSDVHSSLKDALPDEFPVTVFSASGDEVLTFSRAGDIPVSIDLPEGSYYVVAHSGNDLPAAFENDYYYGKSEIFTIVAGETTTISVTCVLSNIMVTVVYSASVTSDFETYRTTVTNAGGSLVYNETETRAGYFDQGPLDIEAILTWTDGSGTLQTLTLKGNIASPEAGKHYEIHIEASLSGGYGTINLQVDESYETEIVTISDEGPAMSGELLITEIMFNPASLSDTEGEFIEVKNVSAGSVNLKDLVIRRGSNNDIHVISSDLTLLPGEIALLARSALAAAEVDYVYSTISLLNTGDELFINSYGTDGTNGAVICMVDYGAAGFITSLSGSSIQLDPLVTGADEALLGSNWCVSTSTFSTGDYGTPGQENLSCP